jgi:myosin protein heavy chain
MDFVDTKLLSISEVSEKVEMQKKEIDKEAEKKLNSLKNDVDSIIKQSRLDLLFIMDITNSMDYYLDEAKNGILDMIKKIQIECPGSEIFLGFIGYKDFNDLDFGEEYINLEFTTDYEKIKNNISFLKAEGGGDIPEDLCGAFDLAKNKNWTGKTRFAILVTDSPCHGEKYHDLKKGEDNYPNGERDKGNIEDYIKFFAQNEISLYCLKINSSTDKMFKIFKDIYTKNKDKNSKNEFVVEQGKKIFNIVTENTIKSFQNRKHLEIKE